MRFKVWALLVVLAFGMVGCASYFKRKECEKTNWYQHGHDVAMSGKRLDADAFAKECQKVEAKMSWTDLDTGFKAGMGKYCTGDNVFDVGRAGKPFSFDMCDGENMAKMKARHREGILVFCTPKSAYHFGTTGGVYQNVCPKNLEADWLPEYRKGRKVYLSAVIVEKEREAQRLDGEIYRLESKLSQLRVEKLRTETQYERRTQRVFDGVTGTYKEQTVTGPSEEAKQRAQQIGQEISGVNSDISQTRRKRDDLNSEISKMRTEMIAL